MTGSSHEASPPPEHLPGRSVQDRGSTVSMTSTTTGLPDRYRPIDQVGPDEPTSTGVIQCWRAKDRVLNRDVAIRDDAEADDAHAAQHQDDGAQDHGDDREAGHELAVDDIVAVDGLRHQPRQRPLGPFGADGVEPEGDAQHRPEEGDQPRERWEALAADAGDAG